MSATDRKHWQTVSRLLDIALETPPGERDACLASACANDPALRQELEQLLRAADDSEYFFDGHAAELLPREALEEAVSRNGTDSQDESGIQIGRYRLKRLLGRGGMGTVYLAERADSDYDQLVALKLLPAAGQRRIRDRFLLERQALARLTHPGIARLLDGGITDDDRPFLVMEYVDGRPIHEFSKTQRLPIEDQLKLVLSICSALQSAHQNLIIHRDLKPSNILVVDSGQGETPNIKLLDFGIAKLLSDSDDADMEMTRTGERWMTPSYAAPEQIRGEATTTATDVYQLGVLLYELLTGQRPFDSTTASFDVQRAICDDSPTPPSRTTGRGAPVRHASSLLEPISSDIDAIVLKALRKEPGRRYASVETMAEDIRRYLKCEPVQARKGTRSYRLRKFFERHRVPLSVAGAAFLIVFVTTMIYTLGLADARDQAQAAAERAEAEARKNADITEFLVGVFAEANPNEQDGRVATIDQVLERGIERVMTDLADQPAEQAELLLIMGRVQRIRGQYDQAATLLQAALGHFQRVHGTDSAGALKSQWELARLYRLQRDYDRALPMYVKLLDVYMSLHGQEDPQTLSVMVGLADALRGEGYLDEAATEVEHAVSLIRSQPSNIDLLQSALAVYAIVLRAQERLPEAEAIYRELLADTLPDHDLSARAATWNNLGFVLRQQKRFGEAKTAYERAFALTVEVYGSAHPDSLIVLNNLASVEHTSGQYLAMEKTLLLKLALTREAYSENHWRIGDAAEALGAGLGDIGRFDDAIAYIEECMAIYRSDLGPDHAWTAGAMSLLAAALQIEQQPERAERLREESLIILRQESSLSPEIFRTVQRTADWYDAHGMASHASAYRQLLGENGG